MTSTCGFWRLIFLKLSLPHHGVRGCFALFCSIVHVFSFFKNGIELSVLYITSVIHLFISKEGFIAHLLLLGIWELWDILFLFSIS
jgi:hypothetical protein